MKSMSLECKPVSIYYTAVEEWFTNHMAENLFENREEWIKQIVALTEYEDDIIVDKCCDTVSNPGDEGSWFEVMHALADIANNVIIQENIDVDQYLA